MPTIVGSGSPRLSIIIPARNEAHRLPPTLEKIACFLTEKGYSAEIIVVDNGSTDGTSDKVREFASQHDKLQIRVIVEPRLGKGAAARAGMLRGMGEILFLCDADLSMPIEQLGKLLADVELGADIAIGSREGIGARRVGEPIHRRLMGRLFNALVRTLGLTSLPDTQCGFKAFRRDVAHDVFAVQTLLGWGFDVEILSIARQRRYSVEAIPIIWNYDADSRVRPFRDAITMLMEIWTIHKRIRQGVYDQKIERHGTIANSIVPLSVRSVNHAHARAA